VPTPSLLLDLLFLLETREDAIQVVLLDTHLCCQLGDRDTGLATDERQCLGGTSAAALATAGAATRCGRTGGCRRGSGSRRTRGGSLAALGATWATRSTSGRSCGWGSRSGSASTGSRSRPANTRQRSRGVLKAVVLVDQRLELRQSVIYLSALLVKKVSHDCVLFTGVRMQPDGSGARLVSLTLHSCCIDHALVIELQANYHLQIAVIA
jgi:hypothetical protein